MKHIVIGILAHVDAGKTTLSEGLLYTAGKIRSLGRVDHRDAYLDTDAMEKQRGITIFSKQAEFDYDDVSYTLLDTPGHVDFSAEMERTLSVLDYAILVISGSDGVQGHTETLWRLLKRYQVPTLVFVNKMDLAGTDREKIMKEVRERLSDNCVDFTEQGSDDFFENVALTEEAVMETFLEEGTLPDEVLVDLTARRKLFPCLFGSALKLEGVEDFMKLMSSMVREKTYGSEFAARVFKITRDASGERLTYLKVTGGEMKVKSILTNEGHESKNGGKLKESEVWREKVNQIRIYSGTRYQTAESIPAGGVCAVTGLTMTYPGESLGAERAAELPVLEPVLNYRLILPFGADVHRVLGQMRQLEEEDPMLKVVWQEELAEIHLQLMGAVQLEILKEMIRERFDLKVDFGPGNIVYKETIAGPVVGMGHFEPLRHYAEVHLLLEPGERGSGLVFASACSEDILDLNWQRLILTHLMEKEHRGVLTGSVITDMQITILTGRAHVKHTEGGDFRQATYRAIRQGLMQAESILLEPWYRFILTVPQESAGRAMADIQRMYGNFTGPEMLGEMARFEGSAPVSEMREYMTEVAAYTHGRGHLTCTLKGYEECHDQDRIVEEAAYNPLADLANTPDSVFCSHGAGTVIPWDRVSEYMHMENGWMPVKEEKETKAPAVRTYTGSRHSYGGSYAEDKELEAIFTRTFGKQKDRALSTMSAVTYEKPKLPPDPKYAKRTPVKPKKEYLLVDGYNIIFAWDELKRVARENLDGARFKLMDLLCNYQGFRQCILICVFDAYKVKNNPGSVGKYHNIHVVYTKEAETADAYIEKTTAEIVKEGTVRVATSDALEQLIVMGHGAIRVSAQELKAEMIRAGEDMASFFRDSEKFHNRIDTRRI